MGINNAENRLIRSNDNVPWLVKQLAPQLFVSESSLSAWRSGRRIPSPHDAARIIKVLTGDGEEFFAWRHALQESYHRTSSGYYKNAETTPNLPIQLDRAIQFSLRERRVSFDKTEIDRSYLTSQYVLFYSELVREIEHIVSIIPETTNQHKSLRDTLVDYRTALGGDHMGISRPDLWRFGRQLRKQRSADAIRHQILDKEDAPLPTAIGSSLEEIVVLHNTFSSIDPVLSEFDKRGADPADRNIPLAAGFALQVVYDASSESMLFDPAVPQTLYALLDRSDVVENNKLRDLVLGVDSTRNAIIVILSEAVRETRQEIPKGDSGGELKKGFLGASGKLAAAAIAAGSAATATAFVIKYGQDIINLTSRLPGGDVIETIVKWIVKAGG